ncbi:MAG: DsrE family protein [Granulosicoccaceae bacterium]|jgi:intracellular sulfur oxidation DsrE/DsrF family protein
MRFISKILLLLVAADSIFMATPVYASEEPVPFVMQLTRKSEDFGHRRAFLQIDKVLTDIGEKKLEIVVVAYEDGIHALLENNPETSQLLTKLANRGVTFKACRISMQAWGLKDNQFPLEVEFVPAGAPEVIRLQMQGYKYWRP